MTEGYNDSQIKDLFTGNTTYFSIPRYQRKYVWEEKNWKQLYEDVEFSLEDESWSHFIGTFVFQKNIISPQNTEYIIIDGQQRIITLQLLFMAIIAALNKNKTDDEDEKKEIERYIEIIKDLIIRKPPKGYGNERVCVDYDPNYKIIRDSIISNEDIDILIQKKNSSNIFECFKYYYNLLKTKSFEQLESYYEKLIITKYVGFNSYSEEYAYSIFETLNARGTQLKQMELMKNYLFHYLLPKDDIDIYKTKWLEVENLLFDNNLDCDDFLYHLFKCKYRTHKTKIVDLYDVIKKNLNKNAEYIKEFYDNVIFCVPLYIDVVNYDGFDDEVSFILKYFKIKNNKQFRSVLLALLYQYKKSIIDDKMLKKLLIKLRNFLVVYNIRGITANRIDDDVHDLAYYVFNARCIRDIVYRINQFLIKDRSFYNFDDIPDCIKKLRYSNHKRYTMATSGLYIYIFELLNKEEYIDYKYIKDYSKWTIEHILNDSNSEDYVSYIGNLLPMTIDLNNKCDNKTYSEKRKLYLISGFSWVKDYADAQLLEPDKESILNRTNIIANKLSAIISLNVDELMEYNKKTEAVYNVLDVIKQKNELKIPYEEIEFDSFDNLKGKLEYNYKNKKLLDLLLKNSNYNN